MSDVFSNWFTNTTDASSDVTIALNSISTTAVSAQAYLLAALEATTPEVRRLFGEYSSQSAMANDSLMELAVVKNWINPYERPESQLQTTVAQSYKVLGNAQ